MSSDLSNKCFPPVSFSLPSWVKNEKFQALKEHFFRKQATDNVFRVYMFLKEDAVLWAIQTEG